MVCAALAIDYVEFASFIVYELWIVLFGIVCVLVDVVIVAALICAGLCLLQLSRVQQLKAVEQALDLIAIVL